MMNILIIEDEIRSARELQRMLTQADDGINVLKIIESVEDAVVYLNENKAIDLIFSDIQLVDGNSFDIYNQVQVNCPIIFCTAFDEYTMDAFNTNAVSYILKPVTIEKVEAALDKYHSFKAAFKPSLVTGQIHKVASQLQLNYKTTILVDQREKIIPLAVQDIAYCYLEKTMVRIVTHANRQYFLTATLDTLEGQLNPQVFFRANRQFLISKNAVANIERFFSRKLTLKLKVDTPETIVISKAKSTDFLKWMEGLQ